MKEFLAFVTIDTWTLIFTWINLLILFFLMKKFLFGPVRTMIEKREQEVTDIYHEANSAMEHANILEKQYTEKLTSAKEEARGLVEEANRKAALKGEEIIRDAQGKAVHLVERANIQIENEKKTAVNEIKNDISTMAVSIASKIIEKDINEADHKRLIESFIDGMGEAS